MDELKKHELAELAYEDTHRTAVATELVALSSVLSEEMHPDLAGRAKQAFERKLEEFLSIQEGALNRMTASDLRKHSHG